MNNVEAQGTSMASSSTVQSKVKSPNPSSQNDSSSKTKIIKRYQNRKLYDTQRSRYVTLDDIAQMIRSHGKVVIIDNKTKADITRLTFTQIVFEAEKRRNVSAPLSVLRDIIKHADGSMSSYLAKLDVFDPKQDTPVKEYVYDLIKDKGPRSYGSVNTGMDRRITDNLKKEVTTLTPGHQTAAHKDHQEVTPTLPTSSNPFDDSLIRPSGS